MKRKRNLLCSILVIFLVKFCHAANLQSPRLMSAPLDLLSESLASSSSLFSQLMLKQHRDEKGFGGPMASALQGPKKRFQPFRRRRQTTTTTTESPARETLVFACPEPEGCPEPVQGQKYEPVRIQQSPQKPRDVLDTIYRQEVVKNKKVMRVRKKQRKPVEKMNLKAVEMVTEMVKEAGPVLSQQEIEIIADVSQEVGAKVNEKQVKVIAMLSEAMGPNLNAEEVKTIAEVSSEIEETDKLASDSTLKVVAEMVKSKVGSEMTPQELQQITEIITVDQDPDVQELQQETVQVKSGLDNHAAEMVAQMLTNIGSDASEAEVEIIADMIKELDKDVPKETSEVMAQVLVEMMPEVSVELVHNVSAVLTNAPTNLDKEDVKMLGDKVTEMKSEASPKDIEMASHMETSDVVQETDLTPLDVETIKEMVEAVDKVLEEPDLQVISMMVKAKVNKEEQQILTLNKPSMVTRPSEKLTSNEAEFLSDVVKLFGDNVTPTEEKELEVEVKKADQTLNENQAEVMTQLLIAMGPEIEPEEIKHISEMVADPTLDIRADNVEVISEMLEKVEADVEAEDLVTLSKMMSKMGPNISRREMNMITRMTGLEPNDANILAHVVSQIGPEVTETEAEIITMLTDKKEETVVKMVKKMGKVITNSEKDKVAKMIMKEIKDEKAAEVVAEVIQEVGPEIVEDEDVEKLTKAAMKAEAIDTQEKVENVMAVLEETASDLTSEKVMLVSKIMERMPMVQVTDVGKQLGVEISSNEVEAVAKIQEVVEEKITDDDAKLIEVMAELVEDEKDDDISLSEATHLVDVLNNLEITDTDQKAKVAMAMVKDMAPILEEEEKIEAVAQVLAEVGPSLNPSNVTEIVKLMVDNSVEVKAEDVKHLAAMAQQLSAPVAEEQVEVVSEVLEQKKGQRITFNDVNSAANSAEIKPKDVQIVMEMIKMVKADDTKDKEELVSLMTLVAGQEIIAPDSSTRLTSPSSTMQLKNEMSEVEAEKISEMVKDVQTPVEEAIVVNEIMHMTPDLDKEAVEVSVKVMGKIEDLDGDKVKEVLEAVKDPKVNIKPEKVEKIAEVTQELDKELTPMKLVVVANLVSQMGPVLTNREKQMVTRLAASSNVDVDTKEVEVISEITNEIGTNISEGEAEIIVMLANEGKEEPMDLKEAAMIADAVQDMGAFMSTSEVRKLQNIIEKETKLDAEEAAVMTEVLVQVGPDVDADVVTKVAEVVDGNDKITPHAVDMLSKMAKELKVKINEPQMDLVVKLIEKSGNNISPREMQMIQRMTNQKTNLTLSTEDVQIVEEMVKMLDTDDELKPKDVKLMALITEELGKKEENEKAEKLVDNLKKMDGRHVGLGEMQAIEDQIEEMEPLMTKSKAQVMSQVLVESDPKKLKMEDVKELAEIVMQTSDDITPGDIEAVAELARQGDEELTEKEVKVVAEMSAKFGDSLSPRETQMIARMMRSSGLTMTLNDIVMVSKVNKIMDSITDNDAKLVAKMTEILAETSKKDEIFTTTSRPFVRVSMLPKKPTISTLPERNNVPARITLPERNNPPTRIKMNMRLKNRPPVNSYIQTTTEEVPIEVPNLNDGDFGLKAIEQMIDSQKEFERNPMKPTIETLRTTSADPGLPEESTQIRLEEFLMRNRPTPFRTFPSEDPPEEEEFMDAVAPSSNPVQQNGDQFQQLNQEEFFKMPGDSFMKITMGQSTFGDKESLTLPEAEVTRDTLKSVAENFAFTKNEPQGMLMNFLMKKKLPLMMTTTTTTPSPMRTTTTQNSMMGLWPELMATEDPLMNLFKLESTTLDRTKSGNFMHMKMGDNQPEGPDPSVLPRLEKTRINLSEDNNSFMSMQMGMNMLGSGPSMADRMDKIKDVRRPVIRRKLKQPIRRNMNVEENPIRRKINVDENPIRRKINEDPAWANHKTPFTMRPTLPVGQATIWPRQTVGNTPFTARPMQIRPSIKPFVHLGVGKENKGNYVYNSLHGNNGKQLQDGYVGLGSLPGHSGIHDDRPAYRGEPPSLKATFGNLEFNLPQNGLPDIPNIPEETKLLRDLPSIDQLDYEDEQSASASASNRGPQYQYGKSYLQNPYGADFIQLEIDTDRYKHNKTRRMGGIHHIPLKIHGYAETSEYPVSTDTERPVPTKQRPKKQVGKQVSSQDNAPLKAIKNAMETLPNAVQNLPDFMQSFVSNHVSWMDKVWPNAGDKAEGKSLDDN